MADEKPHGTRVELGVRKQASNIVMVAMAEGVIIKNEHLPTTQFVALDDVDADETIRLLCKRRGYQLPEGFGSVPTRIGPASITKGVPPPRPVRLGREYIDLTKHIDIDAFDLVVRAIEGVVDMSEEINLASPDDRNTLKARLLKSLGAVVKRTEMRL